MRVVNFTTADNTMNTCMRINDPNQKAHDMHARLPDQGQEKHARFWQKFTDLEHHRLSQHLKEDVSSETAHHVQNNILTARNPEQKKQKKDFRIIEFRII